jgi:hypothetical protein
VTDQEKARMHPRRAGALRFLSSTGNEFMIATPSGRERRLVLRLLDYWRSAAGDDGIPSLEDIDPEAIPDMWPFCFVLNLSGDRDDPVFEYVGTALIDDCGIDVTGLSISAVPRHTLPEQALRYARQALERRVPITKGGEFVHANGARILYRSILLPLGGDGDTIDRLLGAANCKRAEENEGR